MYEYSKSYIVNIEKVTKENNNYRKVICTASNLQLVLMSLDPLEKIDLEKHEHIDQFIRIEQGKAIAIIEDVPHKLFNGDAIIVSKNTYHKIINPSKKNKLKLYTIYSPPNHPVDRVEI